MEVFTKEKIASITMSVIFMASFLSIFYFTYVAKVENEIVQGQINLVTDEFLKDLSLMPNDIVEPIKLKLKTMNKPDFENANNEVEDNNKKIYQQVIKLVAIMNVVGLGCIYFASRKYNFDMVQMVKHNLIVLAFIGATEFAFLNLFAKKFISIDMNRIKFNIINRITNP